MFSVVSLCLFIAFQSSSYNVGTRIKCKTSPYEKEKMCPQQLQVTRSGLVLRRQHCHMNKQTRSVSCETGTSRYTFAGSDSTAQSSCGGTMSQQPFSYPNITTSAFRASTLLFFNFGIGAEPIMVSFMLTTALLQEQHLQYPFSVFTFQGRALLSCSGWP